MDTEEYEVLHHGNVLRQSLTAQRKKRDADAKSQARARSRASTTQPSVIDATTESGTPHTNNQTTGLDESDNHKPWTPDGPDPWGTPAS